MAEKVQILIGADDKASKTLDGLKRKAGGLGGALGGALKTGAIGGGIAIAGLGAASIKMALDFDNAIAEVKTLIPDISDEGFGELKQGVLDLSKEMGVATSEAIPALYSAISAGVPADNAIDFMKTASEAAIGGVTDLETAVDGITTVVNAFGAEAIDAGHASDVMFETVKAGKTTFGELSANLGKVLPTASSLGVSFEEVSSSLAQMTLAGVSTAEATTKLKGLFVEASKGGTKLDKAIKELSGGQGMGALIEEGQTVGQIMQTLRTSMPEQEFKDLFGSVEALDAALLTTGPNFRQVQDRMDDMTDAVGSTGEAFDTMAATPSFKINRALNLLKVTMTEVGIKALPLITKAIDKAIPFLEKNLPRAIAKAEQMFDDLKPTLKDLVDAFVTGFQTITPLVEAFWEFLRDNKAAMIAAIAAIGLALLIALGPVSAAALAIVGMIVLVGLIRNNWDMLKAKADELIAKVEGMAVIGTVFKVLVEVVKDKVRAYISAVQRIITIGQEVIDFFKNVFAGDFGAAWENVKTIVTEAVGLIIDALQISFIGTLKSMFDVLWPEVIKPGIDDVIAELGKMPQRLLDLVSELDNAGAALGEAVLDGLGKGISGAASFAGDIAAQVGGAIKDFINTNIIDKVNRALEFTIDMPSPIPNAPINPPDIPRLAMGTPSFTGGMAVLGENGPELAFLPTGARVLSNRDSGQLMAAGGGRELHLHLHINNLFGTDERAAAELAQSLGPELRRMARLG